MLKKTNALLPRLVDCAREAGLAQHGDKSAVYAQYCSEFGWVDAQGQPNLQRMHKALADMRLREGRSQRSDAGQCSLTQLEAEEIVRWQRDNARSNGQKNMVSLQTAVDTLRSNGHIKAEAIDAKTGELTQLSYTTIRRNIIAFGLSPEMLNTPAPAMRMRTLHANHVWQVDASLCVLYYLPAHDGLQVMPEMLFNSNKPANFKRIENERVWRYLVVDVASGAIYVEYVFGGESGANLSQIFINAMQERKGEFWGVPKLVYCDAGSANTGAVFKGLLEQLGIELQWHMPGNARATGAVEKPQDIVERNFESMLAARPVTSLAQLNAAAQEWRYRFNATAVHTRHKMPRLQAWMQHVVGHLKAAPSVEVCRALAHTKPQERRVTQYLTVDYKGKNWDASAVTGVYRGMKVQVSLNPWAIDNVRVAEIDGAANHYFECPEKVTNDLGYWEDSPIMGQEFKQHAMTAPEKTLLRLAERSAADQPANAGKRAKAVPFGGKIDPFKPLAETYMPTMLPRQADAVHALTASITLPPVTVAELCKALKANQAEYYDTSTYGWLMQRYGDGMVPHDDAQRLLDGSDAQAQAVATGTDDPAPAQFTGLRSVK